MDIIKKIGERIFAKKEDIPYTAAVIVAAGNSTRMNNPGVSKQFIELSDRPAIYYTLDAFENAQRIDEVVIVAREQDLVMMQDIVREFGFEKVSAIVTGGDHRQKSVLRGIQALSDRVDFVAVHDGARPFVPETVINDTVAAAVETGAAAAAVKIKDTVKVVDDTMHITSTLNREKLWAVQTPQVFACAEFRRMIEQATAQGLFFTDDCQIYEHAGKAVRLVESTGENIKLTDPFDVITATIIAARRSTI